MYQYVEEARLLNVIEDVDILVIGGGCTGTFAAIRAARLGATVAVIEKQNCLGGTATSGFVNIWHSLYCTNHKKQIIAGLTLEVIERLKRIDAVQINEDLPSSAYVFNSAELKIELEQMVIENKITLYYHTIYVGVICNNNSIEAAIIENKDGRNAIRTRFIIDATGDGDVARDLKLEKYVRNSLQPPTACFYLHGNISSDKLKECLKQHASEFSLTEDWGWSSGIIGTELSMRADFHVFQRNCLKATDLTESEIEGRTKMRKFIQLLRKYGLENEYYSLIATCSHIGVRETVHYKSRYSATEKDLLVGKRYADAIMNGTYRVDIHHSDNNGITFKYLDGHTETYYGKTEKPIIGSWRNDYTITGKSATYYQLPLKSLIREKYKNFIAVGRMIDADEGAFGALRVMVNLNQLGEAAGTVAYLSVHKNLPVQQINPNDVRRELLNGGSALD